MGIVIEDIYKNYRNGDAITEVLKDVSLKIVQGEFVAIIGPSGSGKSTLMNIMGCLDRPTKGSYYLEGKDISKLNDKSLAAIRNKHIGFVFQSFNLLSQYTALENVELAMLYGNTTTKYAKARAAEILTSLGLGERLNYTPSQLSGGQKQRVAIARAIATSPAVILADEPTGSLDSQAGKEVMQIFRDLNKQGKTVIMVTHDLNIAQEAERIIKIKDGIVQEDSNENKRKLPQ